MSESHNEDEEIRELATTASSAKRSRKSTSSVWIQFEKICDEDGLEKSKV